MSLLLLLCFLVDVSLPWHKTDGESHVDIFLSTSQKKTKTHVVTKSFYIMTWFVCLNKFECLKNVETFQTPTFSPKTWCLRFSNKFCKRTHDVSLRFVGNRTLHSFIIERHIKLMQVQTVYLTNGFFFLFLRSHKDEFHELILRRRN